MVVVVKNGQRGRQIGGDAPSAVMEEVRETTLFTGIRFAWGSWKLFELSVFAPPAELRVLMKEIGRSSHAVGQT
ncbi:hypothetical protein [Mesorhizobium escarrei]|uniref:hypothetical protein n=1 Tax=Mesorhizobium escarrei TaxID=666018 RepID=UPI0020A74D7E|nr:hypothetical protein [Mesorhizobium escarrei]